jgi:outer membrane protein W
MKNLIFIVVLTSTLPLTAQDRADASLAGSVLSMSSSTNVNITRSANVAGGVLASFRFWATPRNGIEFNYAHANFTQKVVIGSSTTSLDSGTHEVSGAYVFRPETSRQLRPFFGAGAALLQFNPNSSSLAPTPQSQNKPGLLYIAGIDYMLSRHLGAQIQFRGLVFAAPSFMNEAFRSNTTHNMSEPTLGFVYRF